MRWTRARPVEESAVVMEPAVVVDVVTMESGSWQQQLTCRGSSGEVRELPAGCARVCGAAAPGPRRVLSRTVEAERDARACGGRIGL